MSADNRPRIRGLHGPIILITIGVLFALNNFTGIHFRQTWPVILIVLGLLSLLGRTHPAPPPAAPTWTDYIPPTTPMPNHGAAPRAEQTAPSSMEAARPFPPHDVPPPGGHS
jgi:hypothetical protein